MRIQAASRLKPYFSFLHFVLVTPGLASVRVSIPRRFCADRTLYERRDVENQRDLAAAQDGRAADAGQLLEQFAQRLDHGLEFAQQRVDHEARLLPGVIHHHHVLALTGLARYLEYIAQAQQRQHLPAQIHVSAFAHPRRIFGRELHAFDDHLQRHHVAGAPDAHQEAVDDRQREGQADRNRAALAFCAVDADAAAQRFHVATDHVQPDAAPGDIGDLFRRGESRLHDETQDFLIAQDLTWRGDPALDGTSENLLAVQPAAVVRHFDHDAARLVVGVEPHLTAGRLATLTPHFRRFDPVVEGVSDQMHERIADQFDHRLVQLGLGAGEDELDVLAELAGQIVYEAIEAVERFADRYHAQLQGAIAHGLDQPRQRAGGLEHVAVGSPLGDDAGAGAGDDKLAHEVDQLVELVCAHAYEAAFERPVLLDQVLLVERRTHQLVLHQALTDQDFTELSCVLRSRLVEVLLQAEPLLQLASGKRAAGDQQIAQLRVVFRQTVDEGDVVGNPAVGRKDADGAVVAKVIKHVLDRLLVYLAGEIQLHAEVARLRVHDACLRHGIEQGGHRSDLAQAAEVADEGQRIEAVAKHVPPEAKRDMPGSARHSVTGALHFGVAYRCFGRLRHTGVAEACVQGREQAGACLVDWLERGLPVARDQTVDQGRHVIAAPEQQGDELAVDRELAGANQLQHAFHRVSEFDDGIEIDGPGRSLDRVSGPEHGIDQLGIPRRFLQAQQGALHIAEQLAALGDEGLLHHFHSRGHGRLVFVTSLAPEPLMDFAPELFLDFKRRPFLRSRDETTAGSPK